MKDLKMKEYCVDLEIAKELKENGFSQETCFYWSLDKPTFGQIADIWCDIHSHHVDIAVPKKCEPRIISKEQSNNEWKNYNAHCERSRKYTKIIEYSAPFSDEILKELPILFGYYRLTIEKHFLFYQIMYIDQSNGEIMQNAAMFDDKKLSNVLAKMLLYLKKKDILNERC